MITFSQFVTVTSDDPTLYFTLIGLFQKKTKGGRGEGGEGMGFPGGIEENVQIPGVS